MNVNFHIVNPVVVNGIISNNIIWAIDSVNSNVTIEVVNQLEQIDMVVGMYIGTFGFANVCKITFDNTIIHNRINNYIRTYIHSRVTKQIHLRDVIEESSNISTIGGNKFPPNANIINHCDLESQLLTSIPVENNNPLYKQPLPMKACNDLLSNGLSLKEIAQELITCNKTANNLPNLQPTDKKGKDKLYNYIRCSLGYDIRSDNIDDIIQILTNELNNAI
jgi:hypothetical protein